MKRFKITVVVDDVTDYDPTTEDYKEFFEDFVYELCDCELVSIDVKEKE